MGLGQVRLFLSIDYFSDRKIVLSENADLYRAKFFSNLLHASSVFRFSTLVICQRRFSPAGRQHSALIVKRIFCTFNFYKYGIFVEVISYVFHSFERLHNEIQRSFFS